EDYYEIVDGYHRYLVMKESKEIADREGNHLPVVIIDKPITERIASTIRHNRARGTHSVDHMVEIVQKLVESGLSDQWIMKNLGMDKDELLRLKQISGLASLFAQESFSKSWEEI
ncbi:chromosome partitioning protein ParB, partial [Enterococcus faecium]